MENNKEILQSAINSIVLQIELLSHKSQLESTRKSPKINLMEYSSVMFQLSRTLSELIVIQNVLDSSESSDKLFDMINGRNRF